MWSSLQWECFKTHKCVHVRMHTHNYTINVASTLFAVCPLENVMNLGTIG